MTNATLSRLLEYLQIGSDQEDIEKELAQGGEIEIYGHLPTTFLGRAEQFKPVGGEEYDFMNGETLEKNLQNTFYVGGSTEDEVTVELHTPSRVLDVQGTFGKDFLELLSKRYKSNFHFQTMDELKSQGLVTGNDPGEYLTLAINGQHLSKLLDDANFLDFIRQFGECVNQQIERKIAETMAQIDKLHTFKEGDLVILDYLDVNNLPKEFISIQDPEQSFESEKIEKVYYFNRRNGSVSEVYRVKFKPTCGQAVLTRATLTSEEAYDLREALGKGKLFYFRDFARQLIKKYFEKNPASDKRLN